jgi:hypothetical protein
MQLVNLPLRDRQRVGAGGDIVPKIFDELQLIGGRKIK